MDFVKSDAIVLTDMGKDGAVGAKEIHKRGGTLIVQAEESSTVWSLPRAATAATNEKTRIRIRCKS